MSGGPSSQDPFGLVGTLFERKYRVDRVVAEGGFGVVYLGRHLSLDVPVAIKILRPAREVDPDANADLLTQFLDEAKTLAKLRHPSIVGVLDAGTSHTGEGEAFEGSTPWMVLEWLDGRTLGEDLATRRGKGGRTPAECLTLLRPVLEALAHAHEAGIAHRDVKPSNVMLVTSGEQVAARVLDFGVAKWMEPGDAAQPPTGNTATSTRTAAFTPAFAAPEQLSGGRTGPWTDVFALGLVLTEMLLDASPLPLEDPTEHYRAVFAPERASPLKARLDVGGWEQVLVRALAVRPADRQPNAGALLAELDRALPDARHEWLGRGTDPAVFSRSQDGYSATQPSARERAKQETSRPSPWRRAAPILVLATVAASGIAVRLFARSDAHGKAGSGTPPLSDVNARGRDAAACSAARCSAELGEPAVCRRETGKCVALASVDCVVRAEGRDLERDDTIWVGAMFAKTGPSNPEYFVYHRHAIDLARRDFAQIMGSVTNARARPIAVLECDDGTDARRAALHLVDDLGVPAVIGFRSGMEAMDLANTLFVPRGVLMISATNTNPMLTALPAPAGAPRLVFRTTYNTADNVTAIGHFVSGALEPQVRSEGLDGSNGRRAHLRVASLRARAVAGADIGDALRNNLRFNGKSAVENGDDYLELSHEMNAPPTAPQFAEITARLLAFEPDVVVYAGARGAIEGVIAPVERRWGKKRESHRPRWVSVTELLDDVLTIVGDDPDKRRRFFGITPVSDTPANARFVAHYRESFSEPVSRTAAPNSTYDAFYLVAFASYAIPAGEAVTGAHLAEGLGHLVPPGKEIEAGMTGIYDAYAALTSGGRVDFTGATGRFDFDLERGEAAFDQSILCAGRDGQGHLVGVPSGLIYHPATGKLEGELACH